MNVTQKVARTTMYHVAPSKLRTRIQEEGLHYREPGSYWYMYDEDEERPHYPAVYMWDNFKAAQDWAYHGDPQEPMDIWLVDASGLNLSQDMMVSRGPHGLREAWRTLDEVPADRLHLYAQDLRPVPDLARDWGLGLVGKTARALDPQEKQQLEQHIDYLAGVLGVQVEFRNIDPMSARFIHDENMRNSLIWLAPIETDEEYAIGLHELGHIAYRHSFAQGGGGVSREEEMWAWHWMLEQARIPLSQEALDRVESSLRSYGPFTPAVKEDIGWMREPMEYRRPDFPPEQWQRIDRDFFDMMNYWDSWYRKSAWSESPTNEGYGHLQKHEERPFVFYEGMVWTTDKNWEHDAMVRAIAASLGIDEEEVWSHTERKEDGTRGKYWPGAQRVWFYDPYTPTPAHIKRKVIKMIEDGNLAYVSPTVKRLGVGLPGEIIPPAVGSQWLWAQTLLMEVLDVDDDYVYYALEPVDLVDDDFTEHKDTLEEWDRLVRMRAIRPLVPDKFPSEWTRSSKLEAQPIYRIIESIRDNLAKGTEEGDYLALAGVKGLLRLLRSEDLRDDYTWTFVKFCDEMIKYIEALDPTADLGPGVMRGDKARQTALWWADKYLDFIPRMWGENKYAALPNDIALNWWWHIQDYAHYELTDPDVWKGMQYAAEKLQAADDLVSRGMKVPEVESMLFDQLQQHIPYDAVERTVGQWVDYWADRVPGGTTFPEKWVRKSMAERTGDPELDVLIERFMREEYEYLCGGEHDPENRMDYRKPEDATGECYEVSEFFASWLEQHGIPAALPEDEGVMQDMPWTQERRDPHPWDFGYQDMTRNPSGMPIEDYDPDEQHHVVIVRRPSGTYMIDFTAAQYGYKEFPMVQRLDSGKWQREWASKTGGTKWRRTARALNEEERAQLTEHIKYLAYILDARVVFKPWKEYIGYTVTHKWMTEARPLVAVPHITSDMAYFTALHEMGHVAFHFSFGEQDEHTIEEEAWASHWALEYSQIPVTPDVLREVGDAIHTYALSPDKVDYAQGVNWLRQPFDPDPALRDELVETYDFAAINDAYREVANEFPWHVRHYPEYAEERRRKRGSVDDLVERYYGGSETLPYVWRPVTAKWSIESAAQLVREEEPNPPELDAIGAHHFTYTVVDESDNPAGKLTYVIFPNADAYIEYNGMGSGPFFKGDNGREPLVYVFWMQSATPDAFWAIIEHIKSLNMPMYADFENPDLERAFRRWEVEGAARVMYHAAPKMIRDSILQYGLDVEKGERTFEWYDEDGSIVDPEEIREVEPSWYEWYTTQYPRGTFLAESKEWAEFFGSNEFGIDGYDVWAVDASGLDLMPDPDKGNADAGAWFTPDPIEPGRLTLLSTQDRTRWSREGMALAPEMVAEIERLAWCDTPDWDDWCGNASQRVSDYLTSQGIEHRIESAGDDLEDEVGPNWPYGTHTFIRLSDGTVIDPTITQFVGEGHPVFHASPSTDKTGIYPPGHPAHRYYTYRAASSSTRWRREASDGVHYHVAAESERTAIMEHGLDAGKRLRDWYAERGQTRDPYERDSVANYMWDDLDMARQYAWYHIEEDQREWEGMPERQGAYDIWAIDDDVSDKEPDPWWRDRELSPWDKMYLHPSGEQSAFRVKRPIPSPYLYLVETIYPDGTVKSWPTSTPLTLSAQGDAYRDETWQDDPQWEGWRNYDEWGKYQSSTQSRSISLVPSSPSVRQDSAFADKWVTKHSRELGFDPSIYRLTRAIPDYSASLHTNGPQKSAHDEYMTGRMPVLIWSPDEWDIGDPGEAHIGLYDRTPLLQHRSFRDYEQGQVNFLIEYNGGIQINMVGGEEFGPQFKQTVERYAHDALEEWWESQDHMIWASTSKEGVCRSGYRVPPGEAGKHIFPSATIGEFRTQDGHFHSPQHRMSVRQETGSGATVQVMQVPNEERLGFRDFGYPGRILDEAKKRERCPRCRNRLSLDTESGYGEMLCEACGWYSVAEKNWPRIGARQVMYHLSPRGARESILEHGLNWEMGGGITEIGGNYLFPTLTQGDVNWYGGYEIRGLFDDDYDVWEVDVTGLDLLTDPYLESTMYSPDPIPPDRLHLVTDQWQPPREGSRTSSEMLSTDWLLRNAWWEDYRPEDMLSWPQYKQVKEQIAVNGITAPLKLKGSKEDGWALLDGHHRLLAAHELGIPYVPVIREGAVKGSHTRIGRSGDAFLQGSDGNHYWGLFGAAGVLFRVIDPQGTEWFLLQERLGVQHEGTWSIPGGALEEGEDPLEGALREAEEEGIPRPSNYTVSAVDVFQPTPEWSYTTYMLDVPEMFDQADQWESAGFGWFTREEVPQRMLHPGFEYTWNSGAFRASATIESMSKLPEGFHHTIRYDEMDDAYYAQAYVGNESIGLLVVKDGVVYGLDVAEEYRRKGVASMLLNAVREKGIEVEHDWWALSDDAHYWVRAVDPEEYYKRYDEKGRAKPYLVAQTRT